MSEIQRKFDDISKKYDEQRRKFIPCFDDFYGVTVSIASVEAERPSILDIGAGTGLLSAFLMERYPKAFFTLIDISDKMLDMAKERFKHNPNVKYIVGDYSQYDFVEKYDMAVSALSIHHLEDEVKKELYDKCYSILKPGGIIINADQVAGETPYIEAINKKIWRQSIESSGLAKEEIQAGYERIKLDKEARLDRQLDGLKRRGLLMLVVCSSIIILRLCLGERWYSSSHPPRSCRNNLVLSKESFFRKIHKLRLTVEEDYGMLNIRVNQ